MAADWTTLPLDVLSSIALKLESFEVFFNFSIVCRWWNHSSSLIKHGWRPTPAIPWLLLAENNNENRKIFNHNNNKCYTLSIPQTLRKRCWGSPYGWIAMLDHDYSVRLFNPITKAEILFPSLENIIVASPSCNLDKIKQSDIILKDYFKKLIVLKVPRSGEFVIMVIHDLGIRLAFARHGDKSWTSVLVKKRASMFGKHMSAILITDVVMMGDWVFALRDDAEMVCWNVKKFQEPRPIKPIVYIPSDTKIFIEYRRWWGKTYLVQSGTDLLMLLRYKDPTHNPDYADNYRTLCFEVYKLDPKDKRWHEIDDVGDVALFVGCNSSMSVSVLEATCFQRNCVYFNDDESDCWYLPETGGDKMGVCGDDMGVYNIKTEEIGLFYEGDDTRSLTCPPMWFVPQL